ncbi:hypothetical protein FB45DRAFT_1122176 [Roridomyces roridus]|uniref:F-box domain-containing protein n=1 Tax=Roridomyces roridus TaxID=1738132 RepID=A0AAD7F9C5_9AGAR|nr:hypothetical protein FB45DRAFT_1122176 [Roridomyces roridus]
MNPQMSDSVSFDSDAAASPRQPLELCDLVTENLDLNEKSNLLRCSLVCRVWLPLARGHLRIVLYTATSVNRLQRSLAYHSNTLFSIIRHLELSYVDTLLPSLDSFTRLHSLILTYMEATKLPALPSLRHLELDTVHFDSYPTFLRFISGLPQLETLVLGPVSWDDDGPGCALPVLRLKRVEMKFRATGFDHRFLSALRTRTLRLNRGPLHSSLDLVARYLRDLGPELETLHFDGELLGKYTCFQSFRGTDLGLSRHCVKPGFQCQREPPTALYPPCCLL